MTSDTASGANNHEQPDPEASKVALDELKLTPPETGFGQLCRKVYRVSLNGIEITPEAVIHVWREHFGELWPEGNRFSKNLLDARPGDVAVSDLEMPARTRLFAGVVITEIEPTGFSFVTTRGHTFAATISFRAEREDDVTIAEILIEMRAGDPLFELGLMLGGHAREDAFWKDTLRALAVHLGAEGIVSQSAKVQDPRRKWANAKNITHNAFIRSTLARIAAPIRALASRTSGSPQ